LNTTNPKLNVVEGITILFNRPVSGFDISDVSISRDGNPVTLGNGSQLISPDQQTWHLTRLNRAINGPGRYELTIDALSSGIADAAGNPLVDDYSISWTDSRGAGDANLDGVFNSRDLVVIFQAGEYEDRIPGNSTWSDGDWDGDGDFTSSDLVQAFQTGKYSHAARRFGQTASAVDAIFADRDTPDLAMSRSKFTIPAWRLLEDVAAT
jgi:hypothetical protein